MSMILITGHGLDSICCLCFLRHIIIEMMPSSQARKILYFTRMCLYIYTCLIIIICCCLSTCFFSIAFGHNTDKIIYMCIFKKF